VVYFEVTCEHFPWRTEENSLKPISWIVRLGKRIGLGTSRLRSSTTNHSMANSDRPAWNVRFIDRFLNYSVAFYHALRSFKLFVFCGSSFKLRQRKAVQEGHDQSSLFAIPIFLIGSKSSQLIWHYKK